MKLAIQLKRLAARLPARQQTLEFLCDNIWQELSRDDQKACRQAIASVVLQVLQDEAHDHLHSNAEESSEHE